MDRIKVGLIGCGYWGKNHLRTLNEMEGVDLAYVADVSKPSAKIPIGTRYSSSPLMVFEDKNVDGVVIATPTETHYDLAKRALKSSKHVLVEKPLTTKVEEAEELCRISEESGMNLMVGEIFRFNSAVQYLTELIKKGELGQLRYIECRRVGLGPIRKDVSALWDLATHDIYLSNLFVGKIPETVSCKGISHNGKVDDISCLNLEYKNPDVLATIYVNWEHPIKERKIIIGGTKKAVHFDDVEPSEKIRIYERGVDYQPQSGDFGEFQAAIRDGNIIIPKIRLWQPLEAELRHFIDCTRNGADSRNNCQSNGYFGLETVRVLEAAERSREKFGIEVRV